jgi:hypothetical protein
MRNNQKRFPGWSGYLHVADEQAGLRTGSVVVPPHGIVRRILAVERMRLAAVLVP